jgi:hypothetical protein
MINISRVYTSLPGRMDAVAVCHLRLQDLAFDASHIQGTADVPAAVRSAASGLAEQV